MLGAPFLLLGAEGVADGMDFFLLLFGKGEVGGEIELGEHHNERGDGVGCAHGAAEATEARATETWAGTAGTRRTATWSGGIVAVGGENGGGGEADEGEHQDEKF